MLCRIQSILGGAGLLAAAIALRWAGDSGSQTTWMVGCLLCSSLFYLISVQSVLQKGTSPAGYPGCVWIATVAILPRLLFLTQGPTLTEDLFRYRWEGRVQEAGLNPYLCTPAVPGTAFLQDGTSPRMPGRDVRAGYGPLWEVLERQAVRLGSWAAPGSVARQLLWMKAPSLIGELCAIALLLALLGAHALPWQRVIVWAWCPLTWVEFWGEGHMDSLLVALLLAALLAARRER